MEIEIERRLLALLHEQKTRLERLQGSDLAARFLSATPEEVERTMRGKRTWLEEVKWLWIGHRHPENTRKAA